MFSIITLIFGPLLLVTRSDGYFHWAGDRIFLGFIVPVFSRIMFYIGAIGLCVFGIGILLCLFIVFMSGGFN